MYSFFSSFLVILIIFSPENLPLYERFVIPKINLSVLNVHVYIHLKYTIQKKTNTKKIINSRGANMTTQIP